MPTGVRFFQVTENCQVFCQIVGEVCSAFLPKIKNVNQFGKLFAKLGWHL
jgi:hypothetical protein